MRANSRVPTVSNPVRSTVGFCLSRGRLRNAIKNVAIPSGTPTRKIGAASRHFVCID